MEIKKGINLNIDSEVSRICTVSNDSSSSTRNVLYVIVIACLVQITIFLDTFQYSWSNLKYDKKEARVEAGIAHVRGKLSGCDSNSLRAIFLQNELNSLRGERIYLEQYKDENLSLFKIPIINLQLHVNDTAIISGFLLVTLLIILIYTLDREEINLCIALKSIQNRYSDDSDVSQFSEIVDEYPDKKTKRELLAEINKTRRKHHYNFLTMNEVFTRPSTSADEELANEENLSRIEKNWPTWFLRHKFSIIPLCFGITLLNDILTYKKGDTYSILRTNVHLLFAILFFLLILYLVSKANKKSSNILSRYNAFRINSYKIIGPEKESEAPANNG